MPFPRRTPEERLNTLVSILRLLLFQGQNRKTAAATLGITFTVLNKTINESLIQHDARDCIHLIGILIEKGHLSNPQSSKQ